MPLSKVRNRDRLRIIRLHKQMCPSVSSNTIQPGISQAAIELVQPLLCSVCDNEVCTCPSIDRGSFAQYVDDDNVVPEIG